MDRRTIVAVVAAGVVAVGMTALPATGHDVQPSGTLTFTGKPKPRDQKVVDVRPKGVSVGDRFLFSETLKQAGDTGGRLEVDCVNVDARFQGEACQMTLLLEEGQVAAQSVSFKKNVDGLPPTSTADGGEWAITGGTRAYQGASGTVLVKSTRSGDTVTVAFAP